MFDYLSGTLAVRKPGYAVVDVHGAGYRIEIPLSTYEQLPRSGAVTLYTWLKVSQDDLRLYGFATELERQLFLRLVEAVSGLGPARALAMISNAGVEGLHRAIEAGDVAYLKRVKGIGDKMAKRMIVELKGKLPTEDAGNGGLATSSSQEAIMALQVLGYDRREAEEAVQKTLRTLSRDAEVEELVKLSLKNV